MMPFPVKHHNNRQAIDIICHVIPLMTPDKCVIDILGSSSKYKLHRCSMKGDFHEHLNCERCLTFK